MDAGPEGEGRSYHRPVLVEELLGHMESARDGEIMDGTVGGGGHSAALLERYPRCRIADAAGRHERARITSAEVLRGRSA